MYRHFGTWELSALTTNTNPQHTHTHTHTHTHAHRCFGLLQAAGVKRMVFRKAQMLRDMNDAAQRLGVQLVGYTDNQVCA